MERNELKPLLQKRQKRRDKRMDEEVTECYRKGWRTKQAKGYEKRNQACFPDLACREGIKFRHGWGTRSLDDNLQPLIRYLRSHIGKHWDRVHSDLCRSLDTSTVTGQHVMDHLKHLVHTNVVKDGKRLITHDGHAPRDITDNSWFRIPEFYVHPKSGVLMQTKPKRKLRGPNYRG